VSEPLGKQAEVFLNMVLMMKQFPTAIAIEKLKGVLELKFIQRKSVKLK
jgi:hypothetical protein